MDYNQQTVYYETRPRKAADFRRIARRALKGFWWIAIGVTILAGILGGLPGGTAISTNGSVSYSENELFIGYEPILTPEEAEDFEKALKEMDFDAIAELLKDDYPIFATILSSFVLLFVISVVVMFLLRMFVSSPVKLGYQKFCLNILDGKRERITLDSLFDYFRGGYLKSIGLNFCHSFLIGLTRIPAFIGLLIGGAQLLETLPALFANADVDTFLLAYFVFMGWSLLGSLVTLCIYIPVFYAYSMAHTIMADYPGVGVIEALRLSRQMMRGNKWRMFCLDFSFIGWILLSVCCTCGLGIFFVMPYQNLSRTAFYHEISGRETPEDVEFPSINPEDYYIN